MLTQKTTAAIYNCHQQIINAEKLIANVKNTTDKHPLGEKLVDVFGNSHNSLQLGVPNGDISHSLFNVDLDL